MAVVRLRCWNIKQGMEKQARVELDKIYSIRRDAPGYLYRVELKNAQSPRQIAILAFWKDTKSADDFARSDHTMSHLSSMRRWAEEGTLAGEIYEVDTDLKDSPK